MLTKPISDSRL